MMSQAESIRKYVKENPKATNKEISEALGICVNSVKANISRDKKDGKCIKTDEGLDYNAYFKSDEERKELFKYKNSTRRELIEILMETMNRETDSGEIRLLAKEINKLLNEVTQWPLKTKDENLLKMKLELSI